MFGAEFEEWLQTVKAGDKICIQNSRNITEQTVSAVLKTQIQTVEGHKYSRKDGYEVGLRYSSKYYRDRIAHPDDAAKTKAEWERTDRHRDLLRSVRNFSFGHLSTEQLAEVLALLESKLAEQQQAISKGQEGGGEPITPD